MCADALVKEAHLGSVPEPTAPILPPIVKVTHDGPDEFVPEQSHDVKVRHIRHMM